MPGTQVQTGLPVGNGTGMSPRHDTVLLDVDGTLVDTTYHHALAWARAFRSLDVDVPLWEVHRAIGMGGDKLVAAVAGDEVEQRHGDDLRQRWLEEYEPLRAEVLPLPGAADLVRLLKDRGFRVALASSGKPQHTEQAVELLGVGDLLDAVTTSEETSESKPEPSIPETALKKAGGTSAIMVGDSTFDIEAAARMGAPVRRRSAPAASASTSSRAPGRCWSPTTRARC